MYVNASANYKRFDDCGWHVFDHLAIKRFATFAVFPGADRKHESVKKLEEEQQALGKELEYALSDEFVEKEARDKLLMAKPGEVVVILPPYDEVTSSSDLVFDEDRKEELENWEKWVRLFF